MHGIWCPKCSAWINATTRSYHVEDEFGGFWFVYCPICEQWQQTIIPPDNDPSWDWEDAWYTGDDAKHLQSPD